MYVKNKLHENHLSPHGQQRRKLAFDLMFDRNVTD